MAAQQVNAEEIKRYLSELNEELRSMDVKGEICLYGGAVMALAYKARPDTDDVDAIFEPVRYIQKAARLVAQKNGLPVGWLNNAIDIFLANHERRILLDLSHLKVYVPPPDYLLANEGVERAGRNNGSKCPQDIDRKTGSKERG